MDRNEFDKIIKACRFCLMCRHLCTVGNITYVETNTPRGQALMLDCLGSEALEDNEENRKRSAEVVFECCYCGHCENNCVSSYRHPDAIINARADFKDSEIPEKVRGYRALALKCGGFYENQKQLSGKTDIKNADVLLYAGSFIRNEAQEIAEAAISVLEKAGVNYTLISKESCSGIDAYLVGLPDVSKQQLEQDIQSINDLKPAKIVCLSPIDQRMLSGGIPGLDADALKIPVMSFSAYALELIQEGKLNFDDTKGADGNEKPIVSYHDSDQGGRFLQDYDSPRALIEKVKGVSFKELFWTKGEAASAGEGGGIRFFDRDLARKIAKKRLAQITGNVIDILVTDSGTAKAQLCDFQTDDIKILHIAEFINEYI